MLFANLFEPFVSFHWHRQNYNMAWRCSGGSNEQLVENMWQSKLITHARAKEAFLKVCILATHISALTVYWSLK
jgi:hypothetical protein